MNRNIKNTKIKEDLDESTKTICVLEDAGVLPEKDSLFSEQNKKPVNKLTKKIINNKKTDDNGQNFKTYVKKASHKLNMLNSYKNIDYINSVLPCLFHIEEFNNYFKNFQKKYIKNIEHYPMSSALNKYMKTENGNEKNEFKFLEKYPSQIISVLNESNHMFEDDLTKDPIDFLINLFFILNKELSNNRDNIIKMFTWENNKEKICGQCGKINNFIEEFYTFDLDYQNAFNKKGEKKDLKINECIEYQFQEKNIYNIYCKDCQKKVIKSSLISKITQFPKYFIFVLKDFIKEKDKIKIIFNENKNIEIYGEIYKIISLVGFDATVNENGEYVSYYFYRNNLYEYRNNMEKKVDSLNAKLVPVIFFCERIK